MPKRSRRAAQKKTRISPKINHPLLPQVKALVSPFNAPAGMGQHLVDALPSHKVTLRSRTSVSVGGSATLIGGLSPYFWNNASSANTPSGFFVTAAGDGSSGSVWTASVFNSTVTGSNPNPTGSLSYGVLAPVRPYSSGGDSSTARLVSYGLRVRYTGTALNANGTFKVLAVPHGELNLIGSATYRSVIDILQGSHSTQMKSIYDKAVYEFNFLGNSGWSPSGTGADLDAYGSPQVVGQVSSPVSMAEWGGVFFYTNNSTSAVQFELELIEHWETRAPNLVPFYTDSHTNPELHHELINVVNTAHVRAGLQSEKKLMSVVQDVAKASKSPMGKVILAAALG